MRESQLRNMQPVNVRQSDIDWAVRHIQGGIEAGRDGTDVEDLTAKGVFAHVLLELGVRLVVEEAGPDQA